MAQAFTMIAMGFSFALVGVGNIWIALERHTPISEPLQWFCLTCFSGFVLAGVARVIFEAIKQS